MAAAKGLGNSIAPPRFIAFALIAAIGVAAGTMLLGWREGVMAGFDVAALAFLLSCWPLMNDTPSEMRQAAKRNDANRAGLLAITGGVSLVVLVAVASVLMEKDAPKPAMLALIIATLVLSWSFSNLIYALHYAHMFYADAKGEDKGGLGFPDTPEPCYWDFVYFSFCLGMTFQTSDSEIQTASLRKVVTFHCLAAFVFNIGVLAFTINVIGGS